MSNFETGKEESGKDEVAAIGSYSSAAKKDGERNKAEQPEAWTQAQRNRLKAIRSMIGELSRAPEGLVREAIYEGLSLPTLSDVIRAYAPTANVCPVCRKQLEHLTDFRPLCKGLSDFATMPTHYVCEDCAEAIILGLSKNEGIAGLFEDSELLDGLDTETDEETVGEIKSALGVTESVVPVSRRAVYSLFSTPKLMTDFDVTLADIRVQAAYVEGCKKIVAKQGGKCIGLPVFGLVHEDEGVSSFDSSIVDYLPCVGNLAQSQRRAMDNTPVELLSKDFAHLTYVSKVGAQCSSCAAVMRGRQSARLTAKERNTSNVRSKTAKLKRLVAYTYAKRVLAERFLYVVEEVQGFRLSGLRCESLAFLSKSPGYCRPVGAALWYDWLQGKPVHTVHKKASALGSLSEFFGNS